MKTEKAEVIWEYRDNGQLAYEEYCINGKRHKPNGPAYRYWHENGQLACEQYWINGKCHNPNGPAYRNWYSNGQLATEEYWLDGKQLTKEQFENRNQTCDCEGKVVEIEGKKYELKLVS